MRMVHPGNTGPQPTDPSEYDLRLRQVFSTATSRFRMALELEARSGGYVQGFVGAGDIPIPTRAIKLREKLPRVIDGKQTIGEWIIHAPKDYNGETFLEVFWLERVSRGTDFRVATLYQYDIEGRKEISDNEGLIGAQVDIDALEATREDDEDHHIGLEAIADAKTETLRRVAVAMADDFELVPFNF